MQWTRRARRKPSGRHCCGAGITSRHGHHTLLVRQRCWHRLLVNRGYTLITGLESDFAVCFAGGRDDQAVSGQDRGDRDSRRGGCAAAVAAAVQRRLWRRDGVHSAAHCHVSATNSYVAGCNAWICIRWWHDLHACQATLFLLCAELKLGRHMQHSRKQVKYSVALPYRQLKSERPQNPCPDPWWIPGECQGTAHASHMA